MAKKPTTSPWTTASNTTKETTKDEKKEHEDSVAKAKEEMAAVESLTSPTTPDLDKTIDFESAKIDPTDFNAIREVLKLTSLREAAGKLNLHIGIHGMPKVGKTRFAMSAADFNGLEIDAGDRKIKIPPAWPVVIIGTEDGSRQLSTQVPENYLDRVFIKEVYRENHSTFECDPLASLREVDKVISGLRYIKQGTIVIDSFPDVVGWMNGVLRLKVLNVSTSKSVEPSDYWWRNDKMRGMIMKLFHIKNVHVILTAQDEEVVRDARLTPTGIFKPNWYKKVPYWVDFVARAVKMQVGKKINRWIDIEDTRFEIPQDEQPGPINPPTFKNLVEKYHKAFARPVKRHAKMD